MTALLHKERGKSQQQYLTRYIVEAQSHSFEACGYKALRCTASYFASSTNLK